MSAVPNQIQAICYGACRALIARYKTMLSGSTIGILLLLFLSGEFVRRKKP